MPTDYSEYPDVLEPMDSDDSGESIEGCDDYEEEITLCLFCDNTTHGVEDAIAHLKKVHNISLGALKAKFHMDQYSYIKLINFIRRENADAATIATAQDDIWKDEKYLKPVDYEPWLTYDFDGLQPEHIEAAPGDEVKRLEAINVQLMREIKEKDRLLEQATQTIEKMRKDIKLLLEETPSEGEKRQNCVSTVSLEADESYFSSYAHFSIHHDMLSDVVRTSSYRDALLKNKHSLSDKTVLDVGCGTAILSMFASQAGAKKVIAIDNSEIIYNAMDIARKNNFTNIEFVKGRLEDTTLPVEKVDVIVSEWMGYFLIFEGMLDTIIYARKRHLSPGGIIVPNRCNISLVGYGDESRFREYIACWDSVYNFDMSSMKMEVLQEPLVEVCKPEFVLTDPNVIATYELNTVDLDYPNFSYNFSLKVTKAGALTSLVGYFDTFFDLPNKVGFSTSPHDKPTHWKQVVFFLDTPVKVELASTVSGTIMCQRNPKDLRSLKIKIKLFDKEFFYHLD